MIQLDAEGVCEARHAGRWAQPNAQHHQIELLLFDPFVIGRVPDRDVLRSRDLSSDGYVAPYELDPGEVLRSLVEALEVLAVGPNVVVEYRRFQVGVVILREDDLLLDVRAADRRAVGVGALDDLSRAHAVNPGNLLGMLVVRRTQDLAGMRTRGTQQPLEVEAGYDVVDRSIAVVASEPWIVDLVARRQDDRPHLDDLRLRLLVQIDRVVLAGTHADGALLVLQKQATFVDVGDERNGLGEEHVDGLVVRQFLIEGIGDRDGAILHAGRAAGAKVFHDIPGLLDQRDLEVPRLTFDGLDFRVGQDLDVGMSVTFDELRRFDAHRAVVGGEGLVQLGHLAADGRRLLDQIDPIARSGEIERGLDAADAATDDHDIPEVAVGDLHSVSPASNIDS